MFFRQRRYGLNGKEIRVLKFRTMTVCEDGDVIKQATKDDPRITRLGAFLRRTSLDELPQFLQVITGEMSIVGPRPHAVAHNESYRSLIKGYMLRHKVKPGITGWAQVNGWRGETDTLDKMEKRVQYDLEYITDWHLGWDLKIILLTIFGSAKNRGAYYYWEPSRVPNPPAMSSGGQSPPALDAISDCPLLSGGGAIAPCRRLSCLHPVDLLRNQHHDHPTR